MDARQAAIPAVSGTGRRKPKCAPEAGASIVAPPGVAVDTTAKTDSGQNPSNVILAPCSDGSRANPAGRHVDSGCWQCRASAAMMPGMARNLALALPRTLAAIADRASMTAAANALHLTQGAVSQQVKRLDPLFSGPVSERSRRGWQRCRPVPGCRGCRRSRSACTCRGTPGRPRRRWPGTSGKPSSGRSMLRERACAA